MFYLMDRNVPRAISGQQLKEMRCWLEDAGFPNLAKASEIEVVRSVAKAYPGGIEAFIADEPTPQEREQSACDPHNDASWGM